MGKKRYCPDCEGELVEVDDSGHWLCPDCHWTGIRDADD